MPVILIMINILWKAKEKVSKFEDYHSHNTHRLDVDGMKQLLLKLDMIKEDVCLK